jgi:hypothetical protein
VFAEKTLGAMIGVTIALNFLPAILADEIFFLSDET